MRKQMWLEFIEQEGWVALWAGFPEQARSEEAARRANEEARRSGEAPRLYWAHQIERAQYEAQRAERQYTAVEPENRVVARELERRWNVRLEELGRVRRQAEQALRAPPLLSEEELKKIHLLSAELRAVWEAHTTTPRDRKRLLKCFPPAPDPFQTAKSPPSPFDQAFPIASPR